MERSDTKELILDAAKKVDELMERKGVLEFLPYSIDIYELEGLSKLIKVLGDLPDVK